MCCSYDYHFTGPSKNRPRGLCTSFNCVPIITQSRDAYLLSGSQGLFFILCIYFITGWCVSASNELPVDSSPHLHVLDTGQCVSDLGPSPPLKGAEQARRVPRLFVSDGPKHHIKIKSRFPMFDSSHPFVRRPHLHWVSTPLCITV